MFKWVGNVHSAWRSSDRQQKSHVTSIPAEILALNVVGGGLLMFAVLAAFVVGSSEGRWNESLISTSAAGEIAGDAELAGD